jgi:hypothetical protein
MNYEKALEDFDKEDIIEANLANILKTYAYVKMVSSSSEANVF